MNKKNVRPGPGRVLVEPFDYDESRRLTEGKKKSAIIIPDEVKEKHQAGTFLGRVVSVDPSVIVQCSKDKDMDGFSPPSEGDVVGFPKYVGLSFVGQGDNGEQINLRSLACVEIGFVVEVD